MVQVPEGFERFGRKSPVTEPWEPIYSKRTADAVILGVRLEEKHTNARGFAHGGFISALADNAMGHSCVVQLKEPRAALTLSLNVDFLNVARVGQWIEFGTTFVKTGGTICFAQCFVTADGVPCARASATFRLMDRP